jgi:hypothetical protein
MKRRTEAPGEKAIAESASRKVKKDQPLTIDGWSFFGLEAGRRENCRAATDMRKR